MVDLIKFEVHKDDRFYKFTLNNIQQLAVERLLGLSIVNNKVAVFKDECIDIPEFDTNQLRLVK